MTTVYIDVLFLVNFIVNLMLYVSSCVIRRKPIRIWCIICAAAIGAGCACAFFFADTSPLLNNAISIFLYLLCAWLVMGYGTFREYLKNALVTLCCAFLFAGVFHLIYRFADVGSIVTFNQNVLYVDIPVFSLLCISGFCCGIIVLISKAFVRVADAEEVYKVEIWIDEKKVYMRAKLDTGNALTDPISGRPVLLADWKKIKDILPEGFAQYMAYANPAVISERDQRRLRMVVCKTATGTGMLPAIRVDSVRFAYQGEPMELHNILIAISKTDLGDAGLLLAPQILKEAEYEKRAN